MNAKNIFFLLVLLLCASTGWTQTASISQTIASINADAQKPGGSEHALKSISASTHVPVATLENEKARTGMSYGDLYVAHAIASAAGKSFDQIVKLKKQGQSWDKIADDNNVSLGGKKVKKNVAAKPGATPGTRSQPPPQKDTSSSYKMNP